MSFAPIIGTVLSVASTVAGMAAQASYASKQSKAMDDWAAWQKDKREAEYGRQDKLRDKAQAAADEGLERMTLERQREQQQAEAERLQQDFQDNSQIPEDTSPAGVANNDILSGALYGSDKFKSDLGRKLNEAAQDSRARTQALANVMSYGNSLGGLGTVNAINQSETSQNIDFVNNKRSGSLATFGVEKAVKPVQYSPPGGGGGFF